ncbi:MAG: hypothetical protein GY938_14470 [Ketobacter sp.]|nr:hypothetical protein [Ketobacter sp.]
MTIISVKSWIKPALLTIASVSASWSQAAIEFGGISFDDNAFADRVLSTDFTGDLTGCGGVVPASIDEAIAGSDLNTWINYGYHDMEPGPNGDYNSAAPPYQYIELAFTDNVVVNNPGNDLAVFQIGTANSVRVGLDKASIQAPYAPGSVTVISDPVAMPTPYYNNCIQVTIAYIDLSDLGVAEGASVYRVFLTSPLMENGDVAWYNPAYPQLGVPELAGAAALHSAAKGNYAPEVDAGSDRIISLPADTVTLAGGIVDDGLPSDTLTSAWSQVSGPAGVLFSNSASPGSQVTFPQVGTYELQLTASDGVLNSLDTMTVTVTAADSQAPTAPLNLQGSTLSNTGVALAWEPSSDNIAVQHYNIYRNDVLLTTTTDLFYRDFMVDAATTYWYTVQAQDPAGNVSDLSSGVVVTLSEALLAVQISSGADDAEEFVDGGVDRFGGDLELVEDGGRGAQHVGLRFQGVALPAGVEIVHAWLEFQADETSSEPTSLTIRGLAEDAPAAFSGSAFDISSRPQTVAYADWNSLPSWNTVGQLHASVDIAVVVQELVDRAGWQSGNNLGFVITGSGRRVAESYDASPYAAPRLFVEYIMGPPVNQAPMVDAGDDATLLLPTYELMLSGSAADDGLPAGTLTSTWSQVSGPDSVVFSDAYSLSPTATFPMEGVYELELSVSDGELSVVDTVTVSVYAPDVTAPSVPANVQLSAANDGSVTISWEAATDDTGVQAYYVYRDGVEVAHLAVLTHMDVGLSELTEYGYQIQAEDFSGNVSALSAVQFVTVPAAPLPGIMVDIRISSGNNDAEEADDGRIDLGSTDLELVDEIGMGNQHVGLRFVGVPVPSGATIANAWLEFEADETGGSATSLNIAIFADTNVAAFSTAAYDITSRSTMGSVAWNNLPAWNALDQKHQTPSIASLVQAVVNTPGWAAGNAMGFVVSGTGTRTAESYNGEQAAAPTLHIEYYEGAPVNQAPTVDAGADAVLVLPDNQVALTGSVTDDGLSGSLDLEWSVISGPDTVSFSAPGSASTTATFTTAGVYVLQLQADDSEFVAADSITVTVSEPDLIAPTAPDSLTAAVSGVGSITVSWSAATDNVGIQLYRLYRDGVLLVELAGLEYVDTDLDAETYYEYQVLAVDVAGNASPLSVADGATTPFVPDSVTVVDVAVSTGTDDAEEADDGRIDLGSTDLELVDEVGMGNQTVGVRFASVPVPAGAIITNAYLQFQADEAGGSATNLNIRAIDEANTPTFTSAAFNISSRNVTAAEQWNSLPAWSVDQNHVTPDIAGLVQQVVNNPGWVSGNAMGFVITGTGTRTAESYNGERTAAPTLHVEYYEGDPVNQAPVANAGSDLVVSMSSPVAILSGAYADDGVTPVTVEWSQVGGPAMVVFSAPDVASPEVTFSDAGIYTLMFSVDDGEFIVSDTMTVTVTAPDATAPDAPVGVVAVANGDASVTLSWNAATDNVGVVAYRVYRSALQIAEVADLTFTDVGLDSETYYEYQISALDAAGNESIYSFTVGVTTPFIPDAVFTLDVAISAGEDDVEEGEDGRMDLYSTDLELVDEVGMGNQRVGLRFADVQLPAGVVITNAWLQFEADEAGSGASTLTIAIVDDANMPTFTADAYNVSSRATAGSVIWDGLPAWSVDQVHQSPNLAGLIQPLVSSSTWGAGNALGFVITGTGTRTAESYNGERPAAPVLHIEYYEGEPVNQAPVVNAGADQLLSLPADTITLNGSLIDDGLTSYMDLSWTVLSGPAGVTFSNDMAAVTDATFMAEGTYELQLSADDGEFTASDSVIVTVLAPDIESPSVPQGVSAVLQANGDVLVNWAASTDNTGVAGYWVYRNGVQVSDQSGAGGFVDSGLGVGSYTYVVGAYDYAGNQSDESTSAVVVIDSVVQTLDIQVSLSEDDAEEQADGSIQLYSSDLEIVDEVGYSLQTVGVRFQGVAIPANAEIVNAYITFEVDEASSGDAFISITAEDSANPVTFSNDAYNITNRTTLVSSVQWDISGAWSVDQRFNTADLSSLIQVLVDRGDWVSGGAMSFIFTGSGTRTVESYNGERAAAPTLHIEYR